MHTMSFFNNGSRLRPLLGAAVVVAALLPVWWVAGDWYCGRLEESQRAEVAKQLGPEVELLAVNMQRRLALLEGLSLLAVMDVPTDAEQDHLERYVNNLLSGLDGAISIAVDAGVDYHAVYRTPDFQALADYRQLVREDPSVRADLERAIQTRRVLLTKPRDWGREDLKWTAWQPIFHDGEFRGLAVMEMDLLPILDHLWGELSSAGLDAALQDNTGLPIFGSDWIFDRLPVVARVQMGNGYWWSLAAVPAAGWESAIQPSLTVFRLFGILLIGLLAAIAYVAMTKHSVLALAVTRQTGELSRVNRELADSLVARRQTLALYLVAAAVGSGEDPGALLSKSLDVAITTMDGVAGAILLEGEKAGELRVEAVRAISGAKELRVPLASGWREMATRVLSTRQPMTLADPALGVHNDGAEHARSSILAAVPIAGPQGGLGVLCVVRDGLLPFSEEELAMLAAIGEQLGTSLETARRCASSRTEGVQQERQRMARALHDSVVQLLSGMIFLAEGGRRMAEDGNVQSTLSYLRQMGEIAQQALKEARLLLYGLRPHDLEQLGLAGALRLRLESVERRAGVATQFQASSLAPLPAVVEEELYWIAVEALNNAAKHSSANRVVVSLVGDKNRVCLEVRDNGKGFDPVLASTSSAGHGLLSMRERVERVGGSLNILSAPGAGAVVKVSVELDEGYPQEIPHGGELEVVRA